MTSHKLAQMFLAAAALVLLSVYSMAQIPGLPIPDAEQIGDEKAGSILFYNIYSSKSTNLTGENTRFNITNTDDANGVFVHLFLVDGNSCSPADVFICLTKSQTMTFLASEIDPDITGYAVALAVDNMGLPLQFNKLIGSEYVKFETGHAANLGAEAVAKLTNMNVVSTDGTLAALFFDGQLLNGSYNRLPRVVAIDNIGSPKDGNDTILILNRMGGNLGVGASKLSTMFGLLYDDKEIPHSYQFPADKCQLKATLGDAFIRTSPRFTTVIPSGRTGWTKFWSQADIAVLGSVINKNSVPGSGSFSGGHNLHWLSLSAAANFVVPVFMPAC